jgi:hypothetical protein
MEIIALWASERLKIYEILDDRVDSLKKLIKPLEEQKKWTHNSLKMNWQVRKEASNNYVSIPILPNYETK